jgi:hypothetical protein
MLSASCHCAAVRIEVQATTEVAHAVHVFREDIAHD